MSTKIEWMQSLWRAGFKDVIRANNNDSMGRLRRGFLFIRGKALMIFCRGCFSSGSRFRWRIAALVNDWFDDVCWYDLCLWANSPDMHPFSEIFNMRGTAGRCARAGDDPHCLKCSR